MEWNFLERWMEFLPKCNRGWNKNDLALKNFEKLISGGDVY